MGHFFADVNPFFDFYKSKFKNLKFKIKKQEPMGPCTSLKKLTGF